MIELNIVGWSSYLANTYKMRTLLSESIRSQLAGRRMSNDVDVTIVVYSPMTSKDKDIHSESNVKAVLGELIKAGTIRKNRIKSVNIVTAFDSQGTLQVTIEGV